jgi:hypothetical protein
MAKKLDAKAKAKRQKIIAAVGGVILLAVLAYQVPSVLKIINKKPPAATAAPAPAPVTPVPGAVPGTPVSTPVLPGGTLSDSDPAAQAGSGQLLSFDRFSSKDPFAQQAITPDAPAAPATPTDLPPPPAPPPAAATPSSSAKRTSAKISVNGEAELVSAGATFPAADPLFRLASVTKTTAKIGISGGSLSTGTTVTLTKGKKVTLMNTADGTRYELVLISTS